MANNLHIKWHKEDGTPIPPDDPSWPKKLAEYPFDLMEVGDCVVINRPAGRVRQAIWYYTKTRGGKEKVGVFTIRMNGKTACRVWRVS